MKDTNNYSENNFTDPSETSHESNYESNYESNCESNCESNYESNSESNSESEGNNSELVNLITENLRVGKIRYSALPIEYSPTSEERIAIMQYQQGHPNGGGNTKPACDEIQNALYYEVDMDTDFMQEENRNLTSQNSIEMQTYIKRIYKYLLPPPSKVLFKIINKLKFMIEEASEEIVNISSQKLIPSNLIKATFEVNYLSQVHASLNNIDKLRRLVAKVQKSYYSFGQGILELTYNIWEKNINYLNYVQQSAKHYDESISTSKAIK
ncbi:8924_t:CDS:2 [Racocetra persica]|uniref:8924_t:CDS:1 n=1 Tax=Racocetra persica TaxID=160502 RepID=A0ACA9M104_9GLOM|nr:8924_t:CDS:2 [Racocetra persica]